MIECLLLPETGTGPRDRTEQDSSSGCSSSMEKTRGPRAKLFEMKTIATRRRVSAGSPAKAGSESRWFRL